MEYRSFGSTGLTVSTLGFGGAPIGFLDIEQGQVADILNTLLDAGVTLIDTAADYSDSEVAIGKAISSRRNEFTLVSKCGGAFADLPGEAWSAELMGATVDRALRRLKTDYLDVMLLHTCDKAVLEKGDALGALVAARDAGKVRFVGYSGDNETVAYAAGLPDVTVVEASFNIVDQANIEALLPIASQRNQAVIAKRPLANAAWKPAEEQQGMFRAYAEPYRQRLVKTGLRLTDFDVSGWDELAIRFTLAIPGVHTAIVGTTSPAYARRNIDAVEKGALPQSEVDRVRAAFASAGGAEWPGLE